MIREVSLVVRHRVTATDDGVAPQTVVALPPDQTPSGPQSDAMSVYVDGALTVRHYDPALEVP